MIKFADKNMLDDLKNIWKECFYLDFYSPYGVFYITNIFNNYKPLVYFVDGKIVSMLTLMPVSLTSGNKVFYGFYIYGVGTLKKYRNRNIATKMLNWVEEYSKKLSIDFNILIPANGNKNLHHFYFKRGFKINVKQRVILLTKNEVVNFITNADDVFDFELGMQSSLLKKLRAENYNDNLNFVAWGENELDIIKKEFTLPGEKQYILNFGNGRYTIVDLKNKLKLKIVEHNIKQNDMGCFLKTLLTNYPQYEFFEFTIPNSGYYYNGFNVDFFKLDKAMLKFLKKELVDYTKPFYFNFGLDT